MRDAKRLQGGYEKIKNVSTYESKQASRAQRKVAGCLLPAAHSLFNIASSWRARAGTERHLVGPAMSERLSLEAVFAFRACEGFHLDVDARLRGDPRVVG